MKKKIVITAGGTSEAIDTVRKITNSSTGKLGITICKTLLSQEGNQIEKIYYICPRDAMKPENSRQVEIINITGTFDLRDKVEALLRREKIDAFIHSMAVSDYTTDYVTTARLMAESIEENPGVNVEEVIRNYAKILDTSAKISSYEDNLIIKLKPTPKIISLIKDISEDTFLVGFKLLNGATNEELYNVGYHLLEKNRCDIVVANDLARIRQGNHEAMFIDKEGEATYATGKDAIAKQLTKILFR